MKKLILNPWLLALFPVLFLYNTNRDMLTIEYIISPAIIVFGASALVFLILNYFSKNKVKSAIITSLFFIFFFSFGHYINFVSAKLFFPGDIIINRIISFLFLFSWLLITGILSYYILRTKKSLYSLNQYLNIVGVIIILFQLSSLFVYLYNAQPLADSRIAG